MKSGFISISSELLLLFRIIKVWLSIIPILLAFFRYLLSTKLAHSKEKTKFMKIFKYFKAESRLKVFPVYPESFLNYRGILEKPTLQKFLEKFPRRVFEHFCLAGKKAKSCHKTRNTIKME